jgi:DNA polymerase III alpha subunit
MKTKGKLSGEEENKSFTGKTLFSDFRRKHSMEGCLLIRPVSGYDQTLIIQLSKRDAESLERYRAALRVQLLELYNHGAILLSCIHPSRIGALLREENLTRLKAQGCARRLHLATMLRDNAARSECGDLGLTGFQE